MLSNNNHAIESRPASIFDATEDSVLFDSAPAFAHASERLHLCMSLSTICGPSLMSVYAAIQSFRRALFKKEMIQEPASEGGALADTLHQLLHTSKAAPIRSDSNLDSKQHGLISDFNIQHLVYHATVSRVAIQSFGLPGNKKEFELPDGAYFFLLVSPQGQSSQELVQGYTSINVVQEHKWYQQMVTAVHVSHQAETYKALHKLGADIGAVLARSKDHVPLSTMGEQSQGACFSIC